MTGRVLGHYHVTEKLGAGGMGEVYRARDTRLNRDVAIKVLPAIFANDRERLMRFEREARVLAQLNHPNIAAIYGLEEAEGQRFLALEYVPGENLRGPLPVEEVEGVARQIIDALEEAHERGVVHRDLKPGNIRITPEGKVKVLDFGLAKAMADEPDPEAAANSPTLGASALTRGGMLLGTAAYMSPEQARGKKVDKRADIFAFGSVLYEMLTGKQAFGGETISDSLAAILKNEPDRSLLPGAISANWRRLLDRCLEKDLRLRLRDIGEGRILLDAPPAEPAPPPAPPPAPVEPQRRWVPWVVAAVGLGLGAGLAAWSLLRAPKPAARPVSRLTTPLPQLPRYPMVAISRDATRLAFIAGSPPRIHLRRMDELEVKPIAGTDNAITPFFSPDGQWIGFFQDRKLKKVQVAGGATMTLCDNCGGAIFGSGARWGLDGNIILGGSGTAGLSRVSAAGGTPQVLTTRDAKKGEVSHRWPHVMPGGEAVLFTAGRGGSYDDARIAVLSLKSGEQRVLVEGGTNARYVPTGPGPDGRGTGHIVYWRNASLLAVPFELRALQVAGSPVPILEGVLGFAPSGFADYSFSDAGTLVFGPGGAEASASSLVWVDRQGQAQPLPAPPRSYVVPRLSPDGRRVAVAIGNLAQSDIWVYELERGALARLTFQGSNFFPGWMPDGSRITFSSVAPDKKQSLSSVPADGSRAPEVLAPVSDTVAYPSWSPDGKILAFAKGPQASRDIFFLPAQGDRKEKPFLQTPHSEYAPEFSPDGRWIAYTSQESGRPEVYVRPAPSAAGAAPGDGRWQISTDGGAYPRWSRSGRELFYRSLEKVMAVEIDPGPAFRARTPKLLFEGRYYTTGGSWDVSADGKRFLMIKVAGEQESGSGQVQVVFEWFEEIRRRVRAGG